MEIGEGGGEVRGWLGFRPVSLREAGEAGLSAAAGVLMTANCGLRTQGVILLLAKDAAVQLGLKTAFLAWKDSSTSTRFVGTFPNPPPPYLLPADWPLVGTLARADSTLGDEGWNACTLDFRPLAVFERRCA